MAEAVRVRASYLTTLLDWLYVQACFTAARPRPAPRHSAPPPPLRTDESLMFGDGDGDPYAPQDSGKTT